MSNRDDIALFSGELKEWTLFTSTKGDLEITKEMVSSFNHQLFLDTCYEKSKTYKAKLCNFELLGNHIFKSDEKWINRDLVRSVAVTLSKSQGWQVACSRRSISCNRGGMIRVRTVTGVPGALTAGPLKTQCGWNVQLKPLVTSAYAAKQGEPSTRRKDKLYYKDDWGKPVLIKSSSCRHTNSCEPSRANRVAVTQASGNYVRLLPTRVMYTLCNYADQGIRLTHQLIKATIKSLWPKHKPIEGQDTFYIQLKVLQNK